MSRPPWPIRDVRLFSANGIARELRVAPMSRIFEAPPPAADEEARAILQRVFDYVWGKVKADPRYRLDMTYGEFYAILNDVIREDEGDANSPAPQSETSPPRNE